MFQGRLEGIALRAKKSGEVLLVESAVAQAERGLVGDHITTRLSPDKHNEFDKQITLIEVESLEAVAAEKGYSISHEESRRNLLTRNVPLNHLVGKRFKVGSLLLEGQELCEPCKHLEKLTNKYLISPFLHRCGLRARIIEGGTLTVGDTIKMA